jgi:hypothetical protein
MATFRDLEPEIMAGHSVSRRSWHGTAFITYSKEKNVYIRHTIDPEDGVHRSTNWVSVQAA